MLSYYYSARNLRMESIERDSMTGQATKLSRLVQTHSLVVPSQYFHRDTRPATKLNHDTPVARTKRYYGVSVSC